MSFQNPFQSKNGLIIPENWNKFFSSSEKKQITAQPYQQYLNFIVSKFDSKAQVKGIEIIEKLEYRKNNHKSETTLLGRTTLTPKEKIPVPKPTILKYQNLKEKKQLLNSFLEFFATKQPIVEKDERKLQFILPNIIKKYFQEQGYPELQIEIFTSLYTPLDFNFGIDGWIEINNVYGKTEKITFDLKNGNLPINKGFADLILLIEEKDGEPEYETYRFKKNIMNFIENLEYEYSQRTSKEL